VGDHRELWRVLGDAVGHGGHADLPRHLPVVHGEDQRIGHHVDADHLGHCPGQDEDIGLGTGAQHEEVGARQAALDEVHLLRCRGHRVHVVVADDHGDRW